ncbi:MAG: Fic family protein [Rickettsiales bacterium]|jgi:prophage maintenance system killer protein|nr:Fic family protein [Rickettsiales bacterium]
MPKADLKFEINENNQRIKALLRKYPLLRTELTGWAKSEVYIENKVLIPKNENISLNYTYMQNQQGAMDYITRKKYQIINLSKASTQEISSARIGMASEIRSLHQMLCKNTGIIGGALRIEERILGLLNIIAPGPELIYYKMDDVYYYMIDDKLDPISKALRAHIDIVTIQPFRDYNKRLARMAMNWTLVQNGYTPMLFHYKQDREKYMHAIAKRDGKSTYYDFMQKIMLRSQNEIIQILSKGGKITRQ